jgi:hypothetical protein
VGGTSGQWWRHSATGGEEDNESLDPVRSCSVPSRGEDFVVSFIGNSWWGASAWYSDIVSSVGIRGGWRLPSAAARLDFLGV